MSRLYYTPPFPETQTQIELDEESSRHLVKVMRSREGFPAVLTDGQGHKFIAEITEANPKRCGLFIRERILMPPPKVRFHLYIAPTKNNARLEWCLEKCVEIGLTAITPIICKHSERTRLRVDRLERIAKAAMIQSYGFYTPKVNEPIALKDLLNQVSGQNGSNEVPVLAEQMYIAYLGDETRPLMQALRQIKSANDSDRQLHIGVMVGPEGGFMPEEVASCAEKGIQAVALGHTRLRTETAGVVACHSVRLWADDQADN